MQQRLAYFDNLKGVLIIFVVIGHCLEKSDDGSWIHFIYTFIYTFHMPLFVMTTGYFCKDLANFHTLLKRIVPYICIYFCFQIIHFTIDNDSSSLVDAIVYPGYSLWYILSLIFWYIIDYFTPPNYKRNWWIVLFGIILSFVVGLIPLDRQLSVQRTFTFLPFFMLGKFFRFQSKTSFRCIRKRYAFVIILAITTIIVTVPFDMSVFLYGQINLWQMTNHIYSATAFKLIYFLLVFSASMAIAALIPAHKMERLSVIGRNSLYIYLYHTLIISLLIKYLDFVGLMGFVYLFLLVIVSIAFLYRIPITRYLIDSKKIINVIRIRR